MPVATFIYQDQSFSFMNTLQELTNHHIPELFSCVFIHQFVDMEGNTILRKFFKEFH
jgi:hypothetical protein